MSSGPRHRPAQQPAPSGSFALKASIEAAECANDPKLRLGVSGKLSGSFALKAPIEAAECANDPGTRWRLGCQGTGQAARPGAWPSGLIGVPR
jgi:hypothetical protein